jgi:chromosome segregation ATPase
LLVFTQKLWLLSNVFIILYGIKIQALREETGGLKKPLQSVRQVAGDLVNEAGEHGVDATHLQDEVDNLADRLDDLQAKLDDRCSELQSAATAVTQFNVSTHCWLYGHDMAD